jgi:imidazoleglycerol phosphate dehydratase HisB
LAQFQLYAYFWRFRGGILPIHDVLCSASIPASGRGGVEMSKKKKNGNVIKVDFEVLADDLDRDLKVLCAHIAIGMLQVDKWEMVRDELMESLYDALTLMERDRFEIEGYVFKMIDGGLEIERKFH